MTAEGLSTLHGKKRIVVISVATTWRPQLALRPVGQVPVKMSTVVSLPSDPRSKPVSWGILSVGDWISSTGPEHRWKKRRKLTCGGKSVYSFCHRQTFLFWDSIFLTKIYIKKPWRDKSSGSWIMTIQANGHSSYPGPSSWDPVVNIEWTFSGIAIPEFCLHWQQGDNFRKGTEGDRITRLRRWR